MILQPPESKSVHHMFKRIVPNNLKTNLWASKYADGSIWSSNRLTCVILNTSVSNKTNKSICTYTVRWHLQRTIHIIDWRIPVHGLSHA